MSPIVPQSAAEAVQVATYCGERDWRAGNCVG